jgi:hypothetical protein
MLDKAGSLSEDRGRVRRQYRLRMLGHMDGDVEYRLSVRPVILKPSSLRKCALHSKYICVEPKWRMRGEKRRS